jgi:citrate lyase subunit gamma (acyl carrier protein)
MRKIITSERGIWEMAEIIKFATAGTDEKSDAVITIAPSDNGLQLDVKSVVMNQFGSAIEASVREVLQDMGVVNAIVTVADRGALDCVLRARVETAVLRGKGEV